MNKITTLIDGHKTRIGAVGIFVVGGLYALGVIDQTEFEKIIAILGAWTAYGLRSAIKKVEK